MCLVLFLLWFVKSTLLTRDNPCGLTDANSASSWLLTWIIMTPTWTLILDRLNCRYGDALLMHDPWDAQSLLELTNYSTKPKGIRFSLFLTKLTKQQETVKALLQRTAVVMLVALQSLKWKWIYLKTWWDLEKYYVELIMCLMQIVTHIQHVW